MRSFTTIAILSLLSLASATSTLGPLSQWKCIQSCSDKANFVWVRENQGIIQCAGPNDKSCYWFTESTCSGVAPSPAPNTAGLQCQGTGPQSGWCHEAAQQIFLYKPQTECQACGGFQCIQSCQDDAHWVAVAEDVGPSPGKRSINSRITGRQNNYASEILIYCLGPDQNSCYWNNDRATCVSQTCNIGQVAGGQMCTGYSGYWCQTAQDVMVYQKKMPVCNKSS